MVFRPLHTQCHQLVCPKDPVPIDQQTGVVYQIPCSDYSKCTLVSLEGAWSTGCLNTDKPSGMRMWLVFMLHFIILTLFIQHFSTCRITYCQHYPFKCMSVSLCHHYLTKVAASYQNIGKQSSMSSLVRIQCLVVCTWSDRSLHGKEIIIHHIIQQLHMYILEDGDKPDRRELTESITLNHQNDTLTSFQMWCQQTSVCHLTWTLSVHSPLASAAIKSSCG